MFAANISGQAKYWNSAWDKRIVDNGVLMNQEKLIVILNYIKDREYYRNADILDVGCGTGVHAYLLMKEWPELKWNGVDLSCSAVEKARDYGLRAEAASIYDYCDGKKYDAFWFLDTLEHMEDHERVAASVRRLARPGFKVFGNIPLYSQTGHSEECERPIGINELSDFLSHCGMSRFWQKIYGCFGYPYMIFEAES